MIKKLILIMLAIQVFNNAHASETYDYNIKKTGDWITGCSQGPYKSCTSVALIGDKKLENPITMYVTRTYFGRTTIGFSNFDYRGGRPVIIKIDGKTIHELELRKDFSSRGRDTPVAISDENIVKESIIPIAKGRVLTVHKYDGTLYGYVSLNGSYAALVELDRQQGLRGFDTAFLLKGNKKFIPEDQGVSADRVAVNVVRNSTRIPTPTDNYIRKNHHSDVFCDEGKPYSRLRKDVIKSSSVSKTILVQINCGGDALNTLYKIYVGERSENTSWNFKRARFKDKSDGELKPLPYLPNIYVSNINGARIESSSWLRKQRDCGLEDNYYWDPYTLEGYDGEVVFEFISRYSMPVCASAKKWIRVL